MHFKTRKKARSLVQAKDFSVACIYFSNWCNHCLVFHKNKEQNVLILHNFLQVRLPIYMFYGRFNLFKYPSCLKLL